MLRPAGMPEQHVMTVTDMFRRAIQMRAGKQRVMKQMGLKPKKEGKHANKKTNNEADRTRH
jgi:hypothetical protein